MPESGGQGGHWPPQYLTDQLTLFQPGVGRLSPPITSGTPNVFHLPASLQRCFFFLGLQMWVDMKPYINLPYRSTTIPYKLGISSQNNYIDQRRNTISLKPGYHLSVQVKTVAENWDSKVPSVENILAYSETWA